MTNFESTNLKIILHHKNFKEKCKLEKWSELIERLFELIKNSQTRNDQKFNLKGLAKYLKKNDLGEFILN